MNVLGIPEKNFKIKNKLEWLCGNCFGRSTELLQREDLYWRPGVAPGSSLVSKRPQVTPDSVSSAETQGGGYNHNT